MAPIKVIFEQQNLSEPEIILKAAQFDKSTQLLMQKLENLSQQETNLICQTETGLALIPKHEIILIETGDNYLNIYTIKNKIIVKSRLYKILAALDEQSFCQISKSSIIALAYLERLENSFSGNMTAILANQLQTQVSRRYLSILKQKIGL